MRARGNGRPAESCVERAPLRTERHSLNFFAQPTAFKRKHSGSRAQGASDSEGPTPKPMRADRRLRRTRSPGGICPRERSCHLGQNPTVDFLSPNLCLWRG